MTIQMNGDQWNEYTRIMASGDLEVMRAFLKELEAKEKKDGKDGSDQQEGID